MVCIRNLQLIQLIFQALEPSLTSVHVILQEPVENNPIISVDVLLKTMNSNQIASYKHSVITKARASVLKS